MGPVFNVIDADQQEEEIAGHDLSIPKLRKRSQPVGDAVALTEAAKMLVAAENPVIIAGRVQRTEAGPKLLAQLAETLQAPVVDDRARMNIANRHPLNHTERGNAAVRAADVVLALDVYDLYGWLNEVSDLIGRPNQPRIRPGTKVIVLGTTDSQIKANITLYARYVPADLAITGDSEATMPLLDPGDRKGSHAESSLCDGDARTEAQGTERRLHEGHPPAGRDGVECEPDQHGAHVRGSVEPDPRSRIHHVVGSQLPQHVAVSAVGDGQALQLDGPVGRRRRRLYLQCVARRGVGEQAAWAALPCR